jgi:hypothetical protein
VPDAVTAMKRIMMRPVIGLAVCGAPAQLHAV